MENLPDTNRSKKRRRIWPWILFIFCFITAVITGAMFASSGLTEKPAAKEKKQSEEVVLLTAHDKATIMIMGVDERADDKGRSDTLMVATIDPTLDKAALLSIPRDTRVKISGIGYDKINAAYAYGGERLTERTVESFLGVHVDHFVIVNTQAFKKVIDAIGGIDIEVEKRMYYEDPWDDDGGLLIDLRPGMQHMDGKTAVTYVRYRDEEGDIGRIKRQQKFVRAVADKVTSPTIITKLPSLIAEVADAVRTDLSVRQILELVGTLRNAQKNGFETEMVPGRPLYIEGVSYWIPDVNKLRIALADTLGVTLSRTMMNNLEREAREYEESIPAGATDIPVGDTSIGKAVTDGRSAWKVDKHKVKPNKETGATTTRNNDIDGAEQSASKTGDDRFADYYGGEADTRQAAPPTEYDSPTPAPTPAPTVPAENRTSPPAPPPTLPVDAGDVPTPDMNAGKTQ